MARTAWVQKKSIGSIFFFAGAVREEIWIFGALCLYWCDVELHMYPIVVSGDSILGAKVSGFDFWRFILGAKVSVLISGDFHLERLFIWVSGRV